MRHFYKISLIIALLLLTGVLECVADDFDSNLCASRYQGNDQQLNNGNGYSLYADSAQLAWGESYILNDYFMLYKVTKDPSWLDKMVQHFDQMIFSMSQSAPQIEPRKFEVAELDALAKLLIARAKNVDMSVKDANGYPMWHTEYPGWRTGRFSAALVKVVDRKSKMANLLPDVEKITDLDRARNITGHKYLLRFYENLCYAVNDLTTSTVFVSWKEFKFDQCITDIPGVSLRVEWTPEPGDTFVIETVEPKPIQYLVHDGMMLYPMTRFIEEVLSNNLLKEKHGARAQVYKSLITDLFLPKWEKYWVDFGNGAGTYRSTESPAELVPGSLLPLNQSNALARALLVAQDSNVINEPIVREKAKKMAAYFKNYLKSNGSAWTWNYWESGDPASKVMAEDVSHGSIDISLVLEAYHRQVEFSQNDMSGFVSTFLDKVWNGSLQDPCFRDRVDDRSENSWNNYFHGRNWVELCEFNPQVWNACAAWFKCRNQPVGFIPSLLYAQKIYTDRWKGR